MYRSLLACAIEQPGNACDDTCIPFHGFPDEASMLEYNIYLQDSRRNEDAWMEASVTAPDSAYAVYVEAHYAVGRAHARRATAAEIGRLTRAESRAWEAVEAELDAA